MTTPPLDSSMQVFLAHLRGNKSDGQVNTSVVALVDDRQPADLRALLELLARVPFAAFESEMLRVAAATVCAFTELEGADEADAPGFDSTHAVVIGSQDSARYLVAAWSPDAVSCKTFAYEPQDRRLTNLHGGVIAGITQFLHDELNQRDDFFDLDLEEAEAELLVIADSNPALSDLFFADILSDEELFAR